MKTTTLVILAAGMGRRFGGTKQTSAITQEGETIVDFSIYDALVTGIEEIVFIVRSAILDEVRERFDSGPGKRVPIKYVCQDLAGAPQRDKPWGTGQAILSVREAVNGDFWVINADDFYGRTTYLMMSLAPFDSHTMAGFQLGQTLSEHGPVSRGQCQVDDEGYLRAVIERKGILRENGTITCDGLGIHPPLTEDTPVSMNFWGFTPQVFDLFSSRFEEFLSKHGSDPDAEFYITEAINDSIVSREAAVRVLRTQEKWVGVTYREDRAAAAEHIEGLRARGIYPAKLW